MHDTHRDIFFSIIMPTYNRRQCVARAIDSVLAQTFRRFELIIVDDGSRDGTEAYIKNAYGAEMSNGTIRYRTLPHNRGAAHARNEGLKMARGAWIAYVDSDNTMRPEFLETFHRHIIANPRHRVFYAKIIQRYARCVIGEVFDKEKLHFVNFIDMGVFVHSAELYKALGGFDTSLRRTVDWDLVLKYIREEEPFFIDRVLTDYYDGEGFSRISTSEDLNANYKKVVINCIRRMSDAEFKEKYFGLFHDRRRLREELRNHFVALEEGNRRIGEQDRCIGEQRHRIARLTEECDLLSRRVDEEIQRRDRTVRKKSEEIRQLRDEVLLLGEMARRMSEEIAMMQSSKFWKLRLWNEKVKFGVLHPVKFLRKHVLRRRSEAPITRAGRV